MNVQEKKWIRFRIYLMASIFIVGFGTIFSRAYQLQVLDRDRLDALARAGYKGVVHLPPKRGTIYDREKHELAVSIEVGSLYAHPHLVKNKKLTADHLALHLNVSQSMLLSLLNKKSPFVWIARRIPSEKARQIMLRGLEGIGVTNETRRFYPGKDIAAHVLGFVGTDNQGLEGIEKKLDDMLKGPQPKLMQMRDALGRPFYISQSDTGDDGMHNVILTIDKDIQYKAQQALEAAVKKAKAKSGECIIMDPHTGEILAMAVVPSFNPNIFSNYQPSDWRNRPIADCYEPGSIIKAFLLAAALEKNRVSPNTQFFCEEGKYRIGGRIIHDTKKHGSLTVSDIIILSSNIGAVKIGNEIGYDTFYQYLRRFGFGTQTGIDFYGERTGYVRPAAKAKVIDQATTYFGQGMSATSLQIAVAMSAIANGGKLMRPYIVKEVTDQAGHPIKTTRPHMIRRALKQDTAEKVTKILTGVTGEKGTAPWAAIHGYAVAGKTGTSQKVDPITKRYSRRDYVAGFVGFVPADKPRLVILASIDEPRGCVYGGPVAGPVFREVGAWTLSYLRIQPSRTLVPLKATWEDGKQKRISADLNRDKETELEATLSSKVIGVLPDFSGKSMREVLREGTILGIPLTLEGTGFAIQQTPEAGAPLEGIATVTVSFRPPA